jgi:hypothetical protein
MNDGTATEIARLEAQIEALTQSIEKCRKIAYLSKLTITAGAVWLGLMWLALAPYSPAALVVAIAAVIGGIVLGGSNSSTWEQAEEQRRQAEASRAELIDGLQLRLVSAQKRLH